MKLRSLSLRTDLIFDRFSGVVIDRGDYLAIKTDARPDYYWGNCLIMNEPPKEGDLERWVDLFEKEIGSRDERGFIALTWDSVDGEQGAVKPFTEFGFSILQSTVLTAQSVRHPPKFNSNLRVRPLVSDEDWDQYIDIHFEPDWEYGDADSQRQFLTAERDCLRAMTDSGLGVRLGVEQDDKLIGDAGVYWEKDLGRFNSVSTHRNYRRQGACSTLIYMASTLAFETKGLKTLVMEADEGYHAAHIYESVGFVPTEKLVKLEWRAKSQT